MTPDEQESMRSRLAAAALDLYRNEGLDAISLRRIAEATGISYTLPYRYFENKDALLARMRAEALGRLKDLIDRHEALADDEIAKVHAIADGYVAFARQYPADYLLMFSSHQPPAERYPEVLDGLRSLFDHAVDAAQRCIDKGLLFGNARDLAHAIWVSVHGTLMLHSAGQLVHGRDLDQLRGPLIDHLLAAARQAPAAPAASSKATSSGRSKASILKKPRD